MGVPSKTIIDQTNKYQVTVTAKSENKYSALDIWYLNDSQ